MAEIKQIKRLSGKEDLTTLVAGDVVPFGVWEEPALFFNPPGLKKGELFFLSRLEWTGEEGCVGVIFEHVDNLIVEKGYFNLNPPATIPLMSDEEYENLLKEKGWDDEDYVKDIREQLPKTQDELFHYGVNLLTDKIKDGKAREFLIENPEKYAEFNKALKGAEL